MAIGCIGWCPINVRFLHFTGHIFRHAICTWRKHLWKTFNKWKFEQKATYCIFLKISHSLLFFQGKIFQRTSEFMLWSWILLFLCTFWHFLLHLGQSTFLVYSLISRLNFESAYYQRLAYFQGNMVCVKFQVIVRKILVLSNSPL